MAGNSAWVSASSLRGSLSATIPPPVHQHPYGAGPA